MVIAITPILLPRLAGDDTPNLTRREAEDPRAGAPLLAPAPAVQQMRRMTGVWFYQNRHGTWRLSILDASVFAYDYEELGGRRRTGSREFTFSARGVLCRAGNELRRLETTEDVVTGTTRTIAVEWCDGAVWVRTDPRGDTSSESPPPKAAGIAAGAARSGARRATHLKIINPPRLQAQRGAPAARLRRPRQPRARRQPPERMRLVAAAA
eukprot:gene6086-18296_t